MTVPRMQPLPLQMTGCADVRSLLSYGLQQYQNRYCCIKKINAKHALILREPVISRFFQLPDKSSTVKSRPVYVKVPISISTYDFIKREKPLSILF